MRMTRPGGERNSTRRSVCALLRNHSVITGGRHSRCAFLHRAIQRRSALLMPEATGGAFTHRQVSRGEVPMQATASSGHHDPLMGVS